MFKLCINIFVRKECRRKYATKKQQLSVPMLAPIRRISTQILFPARESRTSFHSIDGINMLTASQHRYFNQLQLDNRQQIACFKVTAKSYNATTWTAGHRRVKTVQNSQSSEASNALPLAWSRALRGDEVLQLALKHIIWWRLLQEISEERDSFGAQVLLLYQWSQSCLGSMVFAWKVAGAHLAGFRRHD
jgi:hypothetical protein